MDNIVAIIPVRKGSERVPNKNFKKFANSSLLEIKINQLKQVNLIDKIIVHTDSDKAIDIAISNGVNHFRREDYYASSECTGSEFWYNLAYTTPCKYIIHAPCTAPMVKIESYYKFISNYFEEAKKGVYDSSNSVRYIKEFMWLDNKPINYTTDNAPNSQLLPDIMALTFGISIIERNKMLVRKNIVGDNPLFYPLDDIEAVDIDTHLDFEFAEFLYKKYHTT